jgi:hypothetical protein
MGVGGTRFPYVLGGCILSMVGFKLGSVHVCSLVFSLLCSVLLLPCLPRFACRKKWTTCFNLYLIVHIGSCSRAVWNRQAKATHASLSACNRCCQQNRVCSKGKSTPGPAFSLDHLPPSRSCVLHPHVHARGHAMLVTIHPKFNAIKSSQVTREVTEPLEICCRSGLLCRKISMSDRSKACPNRAPSPLWPAPCQQNCAGSPPHPWGGGSWPIACQVFPAWTQSER